MVCALAVGLGAASNAWSQSLIQALSTTYNSNPDLLASRALLRQTDETLAQAVANWRPRITLSLEYNKVEQDSISIRSPPTYYILNGRFTTLQVVQPLFRGGKTVADTKAAQANIQAQRASRGIAGISMGGYGALHLAFRHPELFGSVGAHSAALLEKLPTITLSDSRQLARSRILGDVFGSPLDPIFWKQNDPLTIARTANLAGLQIYFDCGSEDDYGFDAGAVALDKVLGSRHIAHEFHLYPGGHNWVYVADHLSALLQFHFRVFESALRRRNSPQ
jgi:S-formylglutathione hydrolase FrmB